MTKNQALSVYSDVASRISRDNTTKYMRNHYPAEYQWIMAATAFLDKYDKPDDKNKKISILERIYCLEHDLTDRPMCQNCKVNHVNGFIKTTNSYRKWCCPKCQASDKECREKSAVTRKEKYGDEMYHNVAAARKTRYAKNDGHWHTPDFGNKVKTAKLKHYGSSSYVNAEKTKRTKLERYGDETYSNTEKNYVTRKTNFYRLLEADPKVEPLFALEEYLAGDKTTDFKWRCRACGTEFYQHFNYNFKCVVDKEYRVRCPTCFPHRTSFMSNAETDIADFVKSLHSGSVMTSFRGLIPPFELDVYVPGRKLAIEFDGLYWHSGHRHDKNYHVMKTEMCVSKGVRLVHVFEDEWNRKGEIVKSILSGAVGVPPAVSASTCRIIELESAEALEFFDKNHVKGGLKAAHSFGLTLGGELVSAASFSRSRVPSAGQYELLRHCDRVGTPVEDSLGALLREFESSCHPASVCLFADRRWHTEGEYEKHGFRLVRKTKPDYYYVDSTFANRYSRIKFKSADLPNVLDVFDPSKSDLANMRANGYDRIWDCGNLVYAKTYP